MIFARSLEGLSLKMSSDGHFGPRRVSLVLYPHSREYTELGFEDNPEEEEKEGKPGGEEEARDRASFNSPVCIH